MIDVTHRPPATRLYSAEWQFLKREGTGLFVASFHGTPLFRVDTARGIIYAWDKRLRCEIAVPISALWGNCAPTKNDLEYLRMKSE